jgi:hypothetical protein
MEVASPKGFVRQGIVILKCTLQIMVRNIRNIRFSSLNQSKLNPGTPQTWRLGVISYYWGAPPGFPKGA